LIKKMRVFMLFHLRQVDGFFSQTTYQEDSTDGICMRKTKTEATHKSMGI
jgi:hypothetical protein